MGSQFPLPSPNRFVTTHNSQGDAVFSNELPETVEFWPVGPPDKPAGFGFAYATRSTPVHLTGDRDIADMKALHGRRKEMGLVEKNGSVMRYVDYPPESSSPMHRTVSCDYAIVLVGEMECLLDSGESRVLGVGDVLIQRGTMHRWINRADSWARMLYVLLDSTGAEVEGKVLGQDLGGMQGVPSRGIE